jgi:hypothetical protein
MPGDARNMTRSRASAMGVLALAVFACGTATQSRAQSTAKGVVDIQVSEAKRTDERFLAYITRFKAALSARVGGDPILLMFECSENEGQALVVREPGAPPDHLIWQEGKWIATEGRQLRPWAVPDVAAANTFRLSQVREAAVRETIRAYRARPGKAADWLGDVTIGFDPDAGALTARMVVGSLNSNGMDTFTFDPATGKNVVVARAPPPAAPKPPPRQTDDVRHEIPRALAAVQAAAPGMRLGAVRITRQRIDVTLADRSTYAFDATYVLTPGPRYDGTWLCEKGFAANEIDWLRLHEFARLAVVNGQLDEEDEVHARFTVDRSRDCGPVEIEVVFDNYKIPQPWVKFDASGHYKGKSD